VKRISVGFWMVLLCGTMLLGQQQVSTANTLVPRLVRFSGTMKDAAGKPLSSVAGVTFALYKDQAEGAALWIETQNVQPDASGHYTVLLGASKPDGLPSDIFIGGEARWLAVQVQGQEEQPRVLLVAVPYALKAGDADTVGGLPASAFMLATPLQSASSAQSSSALNLSSLNVPPLGGSGTTNYIPIWTNSTTLGNSMIYQTGGNVGIGNTHPAGTLDVSGGAFIRGTLQLPATGTATATKGFNSQPLDALASAFNSGTHTAVNQHFRWQAEPTGNNTSSPSGNFNLLFASGNSVPTETGLSISSKGLITFVSGQKFPGTGTITGVTAGTDLTGGGTSGNVTLNLDTTKVPQLNTANSFNGNQSVTGSVSATGQLISTVTTNTAPLAVSSTTQVANLNVSMLGGQPASAFALVKNTPTLGANTFAGNQTISPGTGGNVVIGDVGCGINTAGISMNNGSGCANASFWVGANTIINSAPRAYTSFRFGNGNDKVRIFPDGHTQIFNDTAGGVGLEVTMTDTSQVDFGITVATVGPGNIGIIGGANGAGGIGVEAVSSGAGGDALVATNLPGTGLAGFFSGDISVTGSITAGTKDFKIDHPLDPANQYLYHASVESSEMMNIYTGNVILDANGLGVVQLPQWFGAMNSDLRYQLTAIGAPAPNLHIAEELAQDHFKIGGGSPGMKVSWQVTAIRQDAFARAHPLAVEVQKPANERGFYLHPELYGAPQEKGILWARHPGMMKRMKERPGPPHPANRSVAQAQTLQASK